MSEADLEELTSAEAGFLWAAVQSQCVGKAKRHVDETAARPLRGVLDESGPEDIEPGACLREPFRLRSRLAGEGDGEGRREKQMRCLIDVVDAPKSEAPTAAKRLARRRLRRLVLQRGGDVSPPAKTTLDLRRLVDGEHKTQYGSELVVLGGAVLGSLEQTAIRRRLAVLLRALPPAIAGEIRRSLPRVPALGERISRRVYEAYARIASDDRTTDQEFALLGLFLIVSAGVFRHNWVVHRFEKTLPDGLAKAAKRYRHACLQSDHPELGGRIARAVWSVLNRPSASCEQQPTVEETK